jgi:CubicO group peptidase (beta-lactamase class C family)
VGEWRVFLLVLLAGSPVWADPIDDYVRAQMNRFHLPGVSLAILEDGRISRVAAYGLADVAGAVPATPETIFKIGSVSKQFIATAIMLLAQDGRLAIDDPASRYLDGTPPAWQPITIRHLLTHTAGLPRESPAFDPSKALSDADVVKALYSAQLRSRPGSKWEYSNAGYYALARSSPEPRASRGRSSCGGGYSSLRACR